ncbi:hypothetical protein B1757_03500 [Acidithiobacillus marinus]|uniref:Glycosyltransferase n=1 Tax=Acidithiobacillus marinus TaxID=187490 RepID=A0A2I1DPA8_9PROT|nr:glycosyltransferase [Acidithiobacillus marinus]PKY11696.1 hypothetical protein B1757_03500 [Acidithiobacillus marinus]
MRRIVIITPDIHGPIKNGGIGTAFSNLAIFLVRQGASVTIAYTLGAHSEDGPIKDWINHYDKLGVELITLNESEIVDKSQILDTPHHRRLAWITHQWLVQNAHRWDIVILPEWGGMGFYALTAKKMGLAYENTHFVVNTHSPEAWAIEGNRRLPCELDDIDRDFMERECVRLADAVVSPSQYMLDWMRRYQWQLPGQKCRVIPNLMLGSETKAGMPIAVNGMERTVFFGRLEIRKGLKLFCDAIFRLPQETRAKLGKISFMGKAVHHHGFDSADYIKQRSSDWGIDVEIITNLNRDQALAELKKQGTLAVMPSLVENSPYTVLECLREGVTFLASKVGGIPEMIVSADHEQHLFVLTPQALADKLAHVAKNGLKPAEAVWTEAEAEAQWLEFLSEFAEQAALPDGEGGFVSPKVSVCVVHYNRPHLLTQALNSLREQTYLNFEVILVDDGSPSAEAQGYLDRLKPEFDQRGWQIVRQSNSYLGAARNNAAAHATGDYLLFMDDDNVALPEMVETFVHAAQSSGADVLTAVMMPFSSNIPPKKPERLWIALGESLGVGLYRNGFGDANALWRKSAFEQLGGYSTDYGVGHEDWELFADAVLSGLRLMHIPKPLYWYRVASNSMFRTGDHWANHARSVRPFLRHNPQGLGMALGYALCQQRIRETTPTHAILNEHLSWRTLKKVKKALVLGTNKSLRNQFIAVWRSHGFSVAVEKALKKASRYA